MRLKIDYLARHRAALTHSPDRRHQQQPTVEVSRVRSNPAPAGKVPGQGNIRGSRGARSGAAIGRLGAASGYSAGAKRLDAASIDALVDGYLAGQTVYELAAEFGIEPELAHGIGVLRAASR